MHKPLLIRVVVFLPGPQSLGQGHDRFGVGGAVIVVFQDGEFLFSAEIGLPAVFLEIMRRTGHGIGKSKKIHLPGVVEILAVGGGAGGDKLGDTKGAKGRTLYVEQF